jgi:hypothetical protein
VNLVTELVAGTAGAVSERVTALDHEIGDHPVEDGAVVERAAGLLPSGRIRPLPRSLCEIHEITDRLGCLIRKKPDDDAASGGLQCSGECCHTWHPGTAWCRPVILSRETTLSRRPGIPGHHELAARPRRWPAHQGDALPGESWPMVEHTRAGK